jgi:hypothetical protein
MPHITVPLDGSGIEGVDASQQVKVLLAAGGKPLVSEVVSLDNKGQARATLGIQGKPRGVRVIVGPADAGDEELLGLQTIGVDVPLRRWSGKDELVIAPIRITPYYWYWWRRWCRTFTINGRLVCPDGSPVPGAVVCAYDVDAWWWWWSKQQVGCATTDANGAFTINFRWCCGWWPWWWWRLRVWELEPTLSKAISDALQREPRFPKIPIPDPQPDVRIFQQLLQDDSELIVTKALPDAAASFDPSQLDPLRERLAAALPILPQLTPVRLWPWWPWHPWWDCTPDIVFRATQLCRGQEQVIVNENWFQARWDIPQQLNVTLTANNDACCVADPPDCQQGDCLALSNVCGYPTTSVGGNSGAPAVPVGYANPQPTAALASIYSDRPFAETVTIRGTVACLDDVDYYRVQWRKFGTATWNVMPQAANGTIMREYWDFALGHGVFAPFSAAVPISGQHVYETVQHYESTHTPGDWGGSKVWLSTNFDVVIPWLTNGPFTDGTYELSVVGYTESGGNLQDEHELLVCDSDQIATIVVTIDNQTTYSAPGPNPLTNPCGGLHLCTDQPATEIYDAFIVRADLSIIKVGACGTIALQPGDKFRVDFAAHDADGHLARYRLRLTFGDNEVLDLPLTSANLSPLGGKPVPAALQVGPTYGEARVDGAASPTWKGGAIRFESLAQDLFEKTCCYQLELYADKRTVVSCWGGFGHYNLSYRSFQVTV